MRAICIDCGYPLPRWKKASAKRCDYCLSIEKQRRSKERYNIISSAHTEEVINKNNSILLSLIHQMGDNQEITAETLSSFGFDWTKYSKVTQDEWGYIIILKDTAFRLYKDYRVNFFKHEHQL